MDEMTRQEATDLARDWGKIIKTREREFKDNFWDKADKVIDRYWDEYAEGKLPKNYIRKRYNVLWAITETLQPAVFNRIPEPVVARRWKDKKPVARTAAEVLQRATAYNFDREDVGFADHTEESVWNLLVPGLGQLWMRYDPQIVTVAGPDGVPVQQKGDEKVIADYVHWSDLLFSKANVWSQVWWVARKLRLFPSEVAARFGPEAAALTKSSDDRQSDSSRTNNQKDQTDPRALVYEIWDKQTRTVLWYSKDVPWMLDVKSDPLKLENFFPCPKPILGTTTTDDCLPKPFYCQYQDQASELDELTARIYNLQDACKVVGVYNAEMGDDFKQMLNGNKNRVIPVRDWQNFAQTGGVQGNLVWLPLDRVVQMLEALYLSREQVKKDIYELTGIADVMRGVSNPQDALETNQLKAQWGSLRVRNLQRDIQRFCRDAMAIAAEIIAEHFSPQNIMMASGLQLPTAQQKQIAMMQAQQRMAQAQMTGDQAAAAQAMNAMQETAREVTVEDVISLIRNDKLRGFSLDIETDSTMEADEAEEKTKRTEFGEAVATMFEKFAPIVTTAPEFGEPIKETFMFILAAFNAGRGLEDSYEEAFDQMLNRPPQQPQPSPDAQLKSQTDIQKTQIEEQGETTRKAMDLQVEIAEGDKDRAADLQKEVLDIAAARESRL